MTNKNLFIVFIFLLGLYGISLLFTGKSESSFKADLIQVDTTQVNSIIITPKEKGKEEIILERANNNWQVSNGKVIANTVQNNVTALLSQLAQIKTTRVAAKNPEKWAEYEVEEDNAKRVKIYENGNLVEEFLLGRFSFNQQTRSGTSFIRVAGENEVYAVDGFLSMSISDDFNSYREKSILKIADSQIITSIEKYGQDTIVANLINGQWTYNNSLPLDSLTMETYIKGLKNLEATDFADDFNETLTQDLLKEKVIIKGNNLTTPITITAYQDTTQEKPYVLHSSQFPDGFYTSDSLGVYKKIFDFGDRSTSF